MQSKLQQTRFLSFASVGLLAALMPLACGSDDDDTSNGGNGGASAGKGGSSSGKAGATGKSGGGGSSNTMGGDGTAGDAGGAGGAGPAEKARLRVIHASPNAPSVDIYPMDSATAVVSGISYGEASEFMEVDPGPITFDLRAAGADPGDDPAFTGEEVELDAGADYTFVAVGDFANAADADVGFRILSLQDEFAAASAGTAVARVVHATSAWATVDLDLPDTAGVDVAALDPFTDVNDVELPATAAFDVAFSTEAGTLSQLTVPKLTAGEELYVIATGNPGFPFRAPANGFALLVVDQDSNVSWVMEQPWLHLVHASDIGTVDLYESTQTAAAAKLLDGLEAEAMGAFQLHASNVGFTLKAVAGNAATGAATGLATGATSTLEAGEHYLGFIAADGIETIHEQFDLENTTKALLRGVHASADIAETVDFGAAVSASLTSALIDDVMPTEASAEAGVAIDPGNVILGATATGTLTPLLAEKPLSATLAPVAGERDFVLLVGAGQLWLVDTSVAGWSMR